MKAIEREIGLTIGVRGNELTLVGAADRVALGRSLIEQLYQIDSLRPVLSVAADKRTAEQTAALATFYLENTDEAYISFANQYIA